MSHLKMDVTSAVSAWRDILGSEFVVTCDEARRVAQTATFGTTQTIPAIIRPGTREEVQECVRVSNRYSVPLYPVSLGNNWGYGSSVPVHDKCVLMELQRLNRITDFNETLGYVTIETGVSVAQLYDFLRAKESDLMLSVGGAPSNTSIIGNLLERGLATGPNAERTMHACGFEIVLPTGEYMHSGFRRFANAKTASLHRTGVGPHFDGLFTQSNLGIVTSATIWLRQRPRYFQILVFGIKQESQLAPLLVGLRSLHADGTLRSPIGFANDYKFLAISRRYPWDRMGGEVPLPHSMIQEMKRARQMPPFLWSGLVPIYSATSLQAKADRKHIKEVLRKNVSMLRVLNGRSDKLARLFRRPFRFFTGIDPLEQVRRLYTNSVFRGIPTDDNVLGVYWRKKTDPATSPDPDRDRCGWILSSLSVPCDPADLENAVGRVKRIALSHNFEPNIVIIVQDQRNICLLASVLYDRDVPGEDERANQCYRELFSALVACGYYPYRMGIQSMDLLPDSQANYEQVMGRLKHALDPNHILSPGRYIAPLPAREKIVHTSRN